jgi:protein-S-isoprenylcysteine O-methyltransferase Ste14
MTDRLRGYLFVAGQFALLAIIVVAPAGDLPWRGNPWTEFVGQLLVLGGLAITIWSGFVLGRSLTAHPMPNAKSQLRTDGPYRIARHPIYTGLLCFAFGAASASASIVHLIAAFVLLGVLAFKARFEERFLLERYGDDYRSYGRSIGRFSPWLGKL